MVKVVPAGINPLWVSSVASVVLSANDSCMELSFGALCEVEVCTKPPNSVPSKEIPKFLAC
jgi:hypothetical protein